jgi:cell division protein FtsW (lipid II flippase)
MALQSRPRLRYPERFLAVFAVASFVAVAAGCLVVAISDSSAGAWSLNLAAWGVGAVMALAVSRFASPPFVRVVTFAAPVGLLASLANPGQAGVHRWIDIGPVHANVAALLLPAFVVALAALVRDGSWAWLACAACAVLLILQPDASQATAFAAAVLIVVVRLPVARAIRIGAVVLVSSGAVMAWLRPDPLAPVAEVEGVVGLAYALSPPIAVTAVVALGGAALAPMMVATGPERSAARTAALALSAYFVFSALTPLFGAFPVPLVGIGVSPVIGFWMGAGLLAAIASREDATPD